MISDCGPRLSRLSFSVIDEGLPSLWAHTTEQRGLGGLKLNQSCTKVLNLRGLVLIIEWVIIKNVLPRMRFILWRSWFDFSAGWCHFQRI